jgi:hypothetical protein
MHKFSFRVRATLVAQSFFVFVLVIAWPLRQPAPVAGAGSDGAEVHADIKHRIMEAYPNRFQARLEQRARNLSSLTAPVGGHAPHFILNLSKRWEPAQSLKIAFKGGDSVLHGKIADAVTEWTQYANLKFDFGNDPATGKYRVWDSSDKTFSAEIRVSFDQSGYYSLVGNDSVNPAVSKPGEESLNLQGFDINLPSDWKAVALHEFGHAISFEHEHQMPLAPCDFRFNDDSGYVPTTDEFGQFIKDSKGRRPGLYTVLGGPPNNWPKAVVDFNLQQLPQSHAYEVGPFDKLSIMKYFFEDWMFDSGKDSPCYSPSENLKLSDGDQAGAAKVYPKAPEHIKAAATLRLKVLEEITKINKLSAAARTHYQQELKKFQDK